MNEKMKGNRNANFNPVDKNSNNNLTKKIRELESQIKSLQKEILKKDEAIEILKKSIGIIYTPWMTNMNLLTPTERFTLSVLYAYFSTFNIRQWA